MYSIGYKFVNDDDTINVINWCAENGCEAIECDVDEYGRTVFVVRKMEPLSTEQEAQVEYGKLITWFNNTYSYKEQKYRRLIALGKTDSDGGDCTEKLNALYLEAEQKRERIQQLEGLLNQAEN